MNKRPISITLISLLFLAMGAIALIRDLWIVAWLPAGDRLSDLSKHGIAYFTHLIALLSGVLMLRRSNWGRWLLVLWLAFHVVLSFFHEPFKLLFHTLLMAVVLFFLFRRRAAVYFSGT